MSTTAPEAPASGISNHALPKGSQQEMADPMGWLMRRTKRIEELLAEPAVMAMADELARHMERYAFEEDTRVQDLDVTILPARSTSYIRIAFGAHECVTCAGTGRAPDGVNYCPYCDGAGHK